VPIGKSKWIWPSCCGHCAGNAFDFVPLRHNP
jgi:hypothetical protein